MKLSFARTRHFLILVATVFWNPAAAHAAGSVLARSGDAYALQEGTAWLFGTAKTEKKVALVDGRFQLLNFRDKVRNHEYVQGTSREFKLVVNGEVLTGLTPGWRIERVATGLLGQGELELRIALRNSIVQVVKRYIVYPEESIIQEGLLIRNISPAAIVLEEPSFLEMSIMQKEVHEIDFSYMTGGATFPGCWLLKTLPMKRDYTRNFDASDEPECLPGKSCEPYGPRHFLGSTAYAPIQIFFNRKSKDGVFVGWDYLGRWASSVGDFEPGPLSVGFRLAKFKKRLAPGEFIETPLSFTGVFNTDLDEMGNQLLDYQYRYKWDYTRDAYFPAIQLLGYWWNGTADWDLRFMGHPNRPTVDFESTFRKVFRTADLMRSVGADMYWRDYGWWDMPGEWNGPDFNETRRYLENSGMKQSIYTIAYQAESGSSVVADHPDWAVYIGGEFGGDYYLDLSVPGVTDFVLSILERQHREWGDFQWRNDALPFRPINGDPTPMLFQEQNYDRMLKLFLDRHPGSSYQGCLAGGHGMNYENLRMAVAWQMTESTVGGLQNYYTSYLFPPDKTMNMPDTHDPAKYDKNTWRNLLWNNFCLTGDTYDPAKLEGLRLMIDIYHFLFKEGVVGRWVKVYHPAVKGDQPDRYLQRLNRDNRKGIIIPARAPKNPVVVYPKGLLANENYQVSFQESRGNTTRTGTDLMTNGITFSSMEEGELIYLNLPMHPGSLEDRIPPTAPKSAGKAIATNMGYSGVELRWTPATDNNWISYYEVFRNGRAIDKVAKGTYYFDHSAGADLGAQYEVRTVDGSGNASARSGADGRTTADVVVIDDDDPQLKYAGTSWKHEQNVWQVYNGTETRSRQSGDAVECSFKGNLVTWYGRMGSATGIADVFIDGELDKTVNSFDADELANIALYSRTFSEIGEHTLRIVARGEHDSRSNDSWVYIDGLQVGRRARQIVEDEPGKGIRYNGSGWKHTLHWRRQPSPWEKTAVRVLASGESLSYTSQAWDSAELSFHGDELIWVGKQCPSCGKADVYVDGKLQTTIDSYAAEVQFLRPLQQAGWQAPLFRASWPTPGEHSIRIVVRSDRNRLSRGSLVYLDAFQIGGAAETLRTAEFRK